MIYQPEQIKYQKESYYCVGTILIDGEYLCQMKENVITLTTHGMIAQFYFPIPVQTLHWVKLIVKNHRADFYLQDKS